MDPAAPVPEFHAQRRMSKTHRNILFTFAVALALALAWELREVLMLVYVSALFAVVLMPVVNGIVRFELRGGRRISKGLAITLLLGSVILFISILLQSVSRLSFATYVSLQPIFPSASQS